MARKELRHDRHAISLLTDHMVITPKYRGKILVGDVAVEGIIRTTCKDLIIGAYLISPKNIHTEKYLGDIITRFD